MDMTTVNNGTYNNRTPHKPRKCASFSQGAVHKTDVGEFQDGYFVMVDIKEPQSRNKNNHQHQQRHLERPKSEQTLQGRPQQQRERPTKDHHSNYQRREGDINVSNARFSSPSRSPNKNRRHSPNSQPVQYDPSTTPTSPNKPRKAYEKHVDRSDSFPLESGSPPKDKGPSPTSSRWAGPAFSNAPPPSSLPLPDFPPFSPESSPSSSPPSQSSIPPAITSLPSPAPADPIPIPSYSEAYYYAAYPPPTPSHYFHYPAYPPSSSLDQLSMDLRRMLHIDQHSLTAIPA